VNARPAALELKAVSAAYGPYQALFAVSLHVPAGGAVALLGPNGAGKSTVVRVIAGLVRVSAGTVWIDGRDVTGRPSWQVARSGAVFVPEGGGVFATLTVGENLRLSLQHRTGRTGLADAMDRAYQTFPALADRRDHRAGTLSGGQQRMLALAQAMAVPPALLVVDELSLGLSPAAADAVYDGLAKIRQSGSALLVVEQHLDRAQRLTDFAVVLERGRVDTAGTSEAVRRSAIRAFGSAPIIDPSTAG
jgi:branched-chain amino acid transport system ATP-binding protein